MGDPAVPIGGEGCKSQVLGENPQGFAPTV